MLNKNNMNKINFFQSKIYKYYTSIYIEKL